VVTKAIDFFQQVSMQFHFENVKGTTDRTKIIFAKIDCIFSLDFTTSEIRKIYEYYEVLKIQPQFFETSDDQTIFMVASLKDCLYIDL
jgi:hypothetical protein